MCLKKKKQHHKTRRKFMFDKFYIMHHFSPGKISAPCLSGGEGGILALTKSSTPSPPQSQIVSPSVCLILIMEEIFFKTDEKKFTYELNQKSIRNII